MSKSSLGSASAAMMSLFLLSACAEETTNTNDITPATSAGESQVEKSVVEKGQESSGQDSVMDQPVDFSSPESVEKSLETIRQQAGEKEASSVTNAIGHMMVYDLSVNRNKDKLYKKLNGKTPNQILAMAQR